MAEDVGNRRLLAQLRASEERLRLKTEELERTVAAQRALDEISRQIVDVADTAEVLQQVVDTAARLLGSDGAHLTMLNDERTDLIPMVMAGTTEPAIRSWLRTQRFPLGGGINGLAASTGSLVWTEDYVNDPRIPHDPADDSVARLELGAAAVAPLTAPGGEVVGTLAITYREPRAIDPRDVALLGDLARQAAIATRNSRLYTQLRERTEALARVVEAQRTLSEMAVQVTSIRDPQPVLQRTVDEAARLLNADAAIINPLTEAGDRLERPIAFSPADRPPEPVEIAPGAGITGLAMAERRVVSTGDYANETSIRHTPELDAYVAHRRIRSVMAAPLVGGAGPIGAIQVQAQRPDAFSDKDAQVLAALGAQAAIAIRNARLFTQRERLEEDLRRRSAELAANQERAKLALELHDSVTQALFSMGLTLRTIELLFDRDPAAARARLADLRDLQNDALAEMRTLIFELRPRGLETDGIGQALRTHAAAVQGRTGLEVVVDVNLDQRLPADSERALYRIAQEALHNVVKHANAQRATIRLRRSGRNVVLIVEDDGTGFDQQSISGAKLGVAGMRQRAEQASGQLTISDRPGGGTRVAVTVPVDVRQMT